MRIEIPELALVAMVGASSSGKTTFANAKFKPTEVLSSDFFRAMLSDDENNQKVSADAFDLLYSAAEKRLKLGRLTVIDATNLQKTARQRVMELAKEQNVHAVAIVLDLPEAELQERNRSRENRQFPERVIRNHCSELKRCIRYLKRDGFRFVYVLRSQEDIEAAEIIRTKLWNDKREEHGPFDIIGDVHGCCEELEALLQKLGYVTGADGIPVHPAGRKAAFLGDLCDRGPQNVKVLQLVMGMVKAGSAIAVPGNHDVKLLRHLKGSKVQFSHGLEATAAELNAESDAFREEVKTFLDRLISHYVLDDGKLVIAHAGLREEFIGRGSSRVREFCLYGETTGETDEFGLPVRLNWAADYRGQAMIVYGHTPSREVVRQNNTFCIDTGCVFGGRLTALRYPEKELVSVDAFRQYYEPAKPLDPKAEADMGDLLTAGDFQGKLRITTSLIPSVDIHENNAAAALEIMSRFAADPHWLIYLPPTMSPCETSGIDGYLEHPLEAFAYYRSCGIRNVVCEQKHMGSRSVLVLCRTPETAAERFGVPDGTRGIIYTRTGRHFFDDAKIETALLDRLDRVLTANGFWEAFETDWVCLDAELMPWSEKAQGLLREQYAPVGNAGQQALRDAVSLLEMACQRDNTAFEVGASVSGQNADLSAVLEQFRAKQEAIDRYIDAYGEYCWTVKDVNDFKIAPFHLLACEGKVFSDKAHVWHMETLKQYIAGDELFLATPYLCVDTEDEASVASGVNWWLSLTGSGGEGMVVKPEYFVARTETKLFQPAVKCRGKEYLRIIYGPEYLAPDNLVRLKKRSLSRKRALALREFSLGMESLQRFVEKEPLHRVHECVFGVLAFESEPVDPRL